MNWYGILQSILTYTLTTFAVAVATWAAKTSKRITILEEHDKMQQSSLTEHDKQLENLNKTLEKLLSNQVEMSTKLDLLLSGKIQH